MEIKKNIRRNLKKLPNMLVAFFILIIISALGGTKGVSPVGAISDTNAQSSIQGSSVQPAEKIYLTLDMDMDERMQWLSFEKKVPFWYDPALFSYLEQNNIPATFFVSGLFARTYPSLMKDLASYQYFSFENHSYDESSFVPGCYWLQTLKTDQEKINQINITETIIKQTTGQSATYFRFPGLCHNSANDLLVQSMGFTINDATINAGDPFNDNVGAIVEAVMSQARNNGVIIMHIGGPNAPKSLVVLQQIIPRLKAEGYVFEKLQ